MTELLRNQGSISDRGKSFLRSTVSIPVVELLPVSNPACMRWGGRCFSPGKSCHGVRLTEHLYLVTRLRLRGVTPPVPHCIP